VIGADLGAAHCLRWGWRPNLVIGDLDSLPAAAQATLAAQGSPFIVMPTRKDETDLELALDYVLRADARVIVIVGVLGGRVDHTLANLLLLTRADLAGRDVCMVDGNQTIRMLRPGRPLIIAGQPGDTLSLIPVGGAASGVTARHVEWPLHAATLPLGAARGISNILIGPTAELSIEQGLILVVHIEDKPNA
jgi:thiamine pyrophosphokinase